MPLRSDRHSKVAMYWNPHFTLLERVGSIFLGPIYICILEAEGRESVVFKAAVHLPVKMVTRSRMSMKATAVRLLPALFTYIAVQSFC